MNCIDMKVHALGASRHLDSTRCDGYSRTNSFDGEKIGYGLTKCLGDGQVGDDTAVDLLHYARRNITP
jgi:hypothetical protein